MILLLLTAAFSAEGQFYYKGRTLTTANGLSDNRVTCFYQDATGFIWIGTRNGLNRYDGHRFTVFRPAAGNSISSEVIHAITSDRRGRIWVATPAGLNGYDPRSGQWELIVPAVSKSENDLPNVLLWDIRTDRKGMIWIASDVFAFTSFDPESRQFTHYDWQGFARRELALPGTGQYHSIQRFVPRNDHEFYLGTSKGLVHLDIRTGKFRFLGGNYYADVRGMHYDSARGLVYLSVQKGRAFVYNEREGTCREMRIDFDPYPSTRYRPAAEQEIWLPFEKGLLKVEPATGQASCHTGNLPFPGYLLPGGVTSVYTDSTGLRWIATPNGAIVHDFSSVYAGFLPLQQASASDGWNHMTGVLYDDLTDSYFVCSESPAMLYIVERATGRIQRISRDEQGQAFYACYAVRSDSAGGIWLLTERHVYRYNRQTRGFRIFPMPSKGRSVGYRDMVEDSEGNLWFTSFQEGVYLYNSAEKKFTEPADTAWKNVRRLGTALFADFGQQDVWIGTFGQDLHRYSLKEKKLYSYRETAETPQYVALNLVNDIEMDERGQIWVATQAGGVFRFNRGAPYPELFTPFSMRNGLSQNHILSIAPDFNGRLWLLSGNGISAMQINGLPLPDYQEGRLPVFSAYSSEVNIPHTLFYNPGRQKLLVAAGGGLLFYYPDPPHAPIRFPMFLVGLNVEGKEYPLENPAEAITLPSRFKNLRFSLAALYYGNSDEIRYQYRLVGYDADWITPGADWEVMYPGLPAGAYTFEARAIDKSGRLASSLQAIPLRVPVLFVRSWYFVLFCLLAGAFVLYLVFRSLLWRLREQKQLNAFATSLYGLATMDDILWVTAQNCVDQLGFEDCVVYLKDTQRNVMVQRAAAGPKNPGRGREILNRIEIPLGKGIVGSVGQTGKAERVGNTASDPRYIVDDEIRLSEITVPVMIEGKVYAVIDAEHRKRGFFTRRHLRMLQKMSVICAERLNKYLTEERLRSKIARDLHDEMGSTLTSINILSKVGMETGGDGERQVQFFRKIKENSARMMESMSDIVWAINPANDNLENVLIRMKEFAAEMLEPAKVNYYFDVQGQLDRIPLNLEQRKDLYLVFKEAVNNAVKYSGATEMNILLREEGHLFRLTITDNGKGFDTAGSYSGNGLNNMQTRAETMKAKLVIRSIPGSGTRVSLEMQLT